MTILGFFRGNPHDWGEVPAALGMTVSDQGLLQGSWNGTIALRGIHTYEIVYTQGSDGSQERDYYYYTELYAILDPALLMGLNAHALSWSGRAKDAIFGQRDLQIGHAELDAAFEIQAIDHELVRRVIREPIASMLVAGATRHPKLRLSDHHVTIEYREYERDLRRVSSALETVGRIAAPLLEIRRQELASWEPELRDSWARVAQAWGLTFDGPRATMHGVVRNAEIVAWVDATASTGVRITLPFQLPCDLSISPQEGDGFFAKLFRGQDVQIGDQAFDDAFVIKGNPEAGVRTVLTPLARGKLLSILERASAMKIEQGALEVWTRWRVLRPEHIDSMLKLSFEAAEAIRPC